MATPTNRTPIKLARGSYSNLNSSLDDIQEGEIIYAEDQNKLYVKEGTSLIDVTGSGGGGGGSTNLSNTANGTSLTIESSSGNNTDLPAATTSAWGVMTDEDKTNLDANTAKTTNATHTGEVTGATSLTIASNVVDEDNLKISNSASDGKFLQYKDGTDELTWATPTDTNTTYSVGDGGLTEKNFTTTLKTKLDGIATGAEVNVQSDWNSSSGDSQILNKPTVPSSLSDLSDVHNATPSDGQVLKWVNAESRWEPGADSTGGGGGGATNLSNTADGTKLTIESSSGNNTDLPAVTTSAWGVMTDEDKTNLDANTAKVTNATHTGDVTGSGALTIADGAVTYAKMQDVSTTDRVLGRDSSGSGDVEEISPASLRTMINVADGANNYTHPSVNHIPAGGSSGQVLKYSSDGTAAWGTDNDTTYSTVSTSAAGLAPTLPGSHGGKFLKADGTWEVPPDTNTQVNIDDTPVNGVTNEAISSNWAYDHNAATGNSAHVPAAGSSGQFLKHDGTWGTPPDTNTQVSIDDTPVNGVTDEAISSNWAYDHNAATGNSAHVPAAGSSGQFLKHDGTWGTPPDTNTQLTEEQVEDFVGGMVTGNTETGITVTYQDADGTLDFAVAAQTPEGTAILSTGETGGTKFLREDGDGTCSWQTVSGGGSGDVTAVTAGTGLTGGGTSGDLTINADVGIGDDKLVQMDDADAADNDYAKFTANGLEGRSATEVKTDLSLNNVENTAVSTWAGSSNITTLGTIGSGTWQGTAIGDTYISSASTWNAKQAALTFGIANTNAVKIDHASVADDDYAKFTSSGIEGRSSTEVKTDLSLNNVENTAISSWAGSSNVTTLGTVTTLTSSTTTGDSGGSARKIFYADTGPDSDDGAIGDIWLEY